MVEPTRPSRAAGLAPIVLTLLAPLCVAPWAAAQEQAAVTRPRPGEEGIELLKSMGLKPAEAPPKKREGQGPFPRLVIRGATLIDGTGAPPIGPVDIVVQNDRIVEVKSVGHPGVPIRPERRPAAGDFELDADGMYVLPGLIDAHAHIATPLHGLSGEVPPAEYVFKLWLAHGVTTVREVGSGNGLQWTLERKRESDAGEITAPRIRAYAFFPTTSQQNLVTTPELARAWAVGVAEAGADGIKFLGAPPEIMQAALEEAARLGLRTSCHHAQMAVAGMNVLDTSGWGLDSMEHWYGLPEALFTDRTVQDYPLDYNYNDEQHRFGEAGRLWRQAAEPGSEKWNSVLDTLLARDFTLVPTLTIYEASRDLMRAMRAEWHDDYTWPTLMRWFAPSREAHGSYWFSWSTQDEIDWKNNYRLWMRFLNDYKNRGGRVATGSDAGYIYKVFGFDYVRELELLQEAGFHPLEVVRSATLAGAQLLGLDADIGSVQVGKKADFAIVAENPLANFKVLYGTGAIRLDDTTGQAVRAGGVRWTVKDGVVYDSWQLLTDVREMVTRQKLKEARQGG